MQDTECVLNVIIIVTYSLALNIATSTMNTSLQSLRNPQKLYILVKCILYNVISQPVALMVLNIVVNENFVLFYIVLTL